MSSGSDSGNPTTTIHGTSLCSPHREIITPAWRLIYWCDEEDVDSVYSRYFSHLRDKIPHHQYLTSETTTSNPNMDQNRDKLENDNSESSEDTSDEHYEKMHDRTNDLIKKRFLSALSLSTQPK
jgi:hypothetical protein